MDWHRNFGRLLIDLFTGSPFVVELEKDLSLKKQLLDIVIVRKEPGLFAGPLPDGLDNLATHNLITFKSHQEALDGWALKELTGHYVNYRKQVSPSMQQLLPESEFRLYAVCARFPHNLAGQVPWEEQQPGVYDCRWGTDVIRVLVLRQLPENKANAGLLFFSWVPNLVKYARSHWQQRSPEASMLLCSLFEGYLEEGLEMSYTLEDYNRDFRKKFLESLTPEECKQVLQKQPLEDRLAGLSPEEILKLLPPEAIERYLKRLKNGPASPAQGNGG